MSDDLYLAHKAVIYAISKFGPEVIFPQCVPLILSFPIFPKVREKQE